MTLLMKEYGDILLLLAILIPASVIDFRKKIIPNCFPVLLFCCGTAYDCIRCIFWDSSWGRTFLRAASGLAAAAAICAICRAIVHEGIGMGDIKLLLALGWYQGLEGILGSMLLTSLLALLTAAVLLVSRKMKRSTRMPFAPYLTAGAAVAEILLQRGGGWS